MRIRQPQTSWNEEGTHLGLTPFYAVDALRYTEADMGFLRQDLWRLESEVLMREEACRVCGKNFLKRSGGKDLVRTLIPLGAWLWTYARQDRTAEIKEHYASHKMGGPRVCPIQGCEEDFGDQKKYQTWPVSTCAM